MDTRIAVNEDLQAPAKRKKTAISKLSIWANVAVTLYLLQALGESLAGLLLAPLRSLVESPSVTAIPTSLNSFLLGCMPSIKTFNPAPWAPGPKSQTVLGLLLSSGSIQYSRRETVETPDGVELLLDFKDDPSMPDNTPVMMILHGIGGGSDSRTARLLSDAIRAHGWRVCVYNRRGHGDSTLLPGPLRPPPPKSPTKTLRKILSPVAVTTTLTAAAAAAASTAAAAAAKLQGIIRETGNISLEIIRSRPSSPTRPSAVPNNGTITAEGSSRGVQHGASEPKTRRFSVDSWFGLSLGRRHSADNRDIPGNGGTLTGSLTVPQDGRKGSSELPQINNGAVIDTAHLSGPQDSSGEGALAGACDAAITSLAQEEAILNMPGGAQQLLSQTAAVAKAVAVSRAPSAEVPIVARSSVITERPSQGSSVVGGTKEKTSTGNTAVPKDLLGSYRPPKIATVDVALSSIDAAGTLLSAPTSPQAQKDRLETLLKVQKVFPQHSDTEDLAAVVEHLARMYPNAPKVALGFSQGSNVLVHYLGLHADDPPPLTAAISMSNAYDLIYGTHQLKKDWVTDAVITRPLKRLLLKELTAVQQLKEARSLEIDIEGALCAHSVRDFDEALLVPAYGFKSVDEYYATQNSKEFLKDVRIPLLLLNNLDDPVIHSSLPGIAVNAARVNPWLIHVCTNRGGHLGWLQGWSGHSWMVDIMLQYCQGLLAALNKGLVTGASTTDPDPASHDTNGEAAEAHASAAQQAGTGGQQQEQDPNKQQEQRPQLDLARKSSLRPKHYQKQAEVERKEMQEHQHMKEREEA